MQEMVSGPALQYQELMAVQVVLWMNRSVALLMKETIANCAQSPSKHVG